MCPAVGLLVGVLARGSGEPPPLLDPRSRVGHLGSHEGWQQQACRWLATFKRPKISKGDELSSHPACLPHCIHQTKIRWAKFFFFCFFASLIHLSCSLLPHTPLSLSLSFMQHQRWPLLSPAAVGGGDPKSALVGWSNMLIA